MRSAEGKLVILDFGLVTEVRAVCGRCGAA